MADNIATLKITLQGIKPAPWRTVDVPIGLNLEDLHDTIQALFCWDDCHLWEFEINRERYSVPFGEADDDFNGTLPAANMTLEQIIKQDISSFSYVYDFGDDWYHKINIVSTSCVDDDGKTFPRFVKGRNRTPPEDIGGAPGYSYFLNEILRNREHSDYEHYKDMIESGFDPKDIQQDKIVATLSKLARIFG